MARLFVDGSILRRSQGDPQFILEGWMDTSPFDDICGISLEAADRGRAVLTMPFTVKLAQGGGVVHGGALTTLADTAVAMAIKSVLPEGTVFATSELTIRFLAPVCEGRMTATALVTGPEGRTFHGEAVVADEEGREVASLVAVFRVARGQGFDE